MPVVTLPDGSKREFDHPVTVRQVAESIGAGLARAALAARVDGKLVDTSFTVATDAELAIITDRSEEALEVIRHCTAHLLAQAVKQLFPTAQVTIGPVIEAASGPGAFDVKISGIGAVDVVHDLGQIGPGGLQQQVIVVVHQTVRMHPRILPLAGRGQISQKPFPVAAALEGARMGMPAFAVSLSAQGAHCQYEPSARFALRLARAILQGGLPPHTMLNVNVPDTRGKVIEGYRLTTLGNQDCRNTIEEKCDPRGIRYNWIGRRETVSAPRETDHLSDYRALEENCISVTPLSLDRTHHGYVQKLARWML